MTTIRVLMPILVRPGEHILLMMFCFYFSFSTETRKCLVMRAALKDENMGSWFQWSKCLSAAPLTFLLWLMLVAIDNWLSH